QSYPSSGTSRPPLNVRYVIPMARAHQAPESLLQTRCGQAYDDVFPRVSNAQEMVQRIVYPTGRNAGLNLSQLGNHAELIAQLDRLALERKARFPWFPRLELDRIRRVANPPHIPAVRQKMVLILGSSFGDFRHNAQELVGENNARSRRPLCMPPKANAHLAIRHLEPSD